MLAALLFNRYSLRAKLIEARTEQAAPLLLEALSKKLKCARAFYRGRPCDTMASQAFER
jgi:hypothetical protein